MQARNQLLESLDQQRRDLDGAASVVDFDRHRQNAISMLLDGRVHRRSTCIPPMPGSRTGTDAIRSAGRC